MTGIVAEASAALAWCFPDEADGYADGVLVGAGNHKCADRGRTAKAGEAAGCAALCAVAGRPDDIEHSQTVADTVRNVLPPATLDSASEKAGRLAGIRNFKAWLT